MARYKKPQATFPISKYQDAGHVQPPIVYQNLSTGPRHSHTYEAQTAIPIDGSNSSLRSLSPFRLRLIPPAIFDTVIGGVSASYETLINITNNGTIKQAGTSPDLNEEVFKEGKSYPVGKELAYSQNSMEVFENVEKVRAVMEVIYGGPLSIKIANDGGYSPRDGNGSQHEQAKAIDTRFFDSSGQQIPGDEVYAVYQSLMESGDIKNGGLGYYGKTGEHSFVHYDVRDVENRWVRIPKSKKNEEPDEYNRLMREVSKALVPGGNDPAAILRELTTPVTDDESGVTVRQIKTPNIQIFNSAMIRYDSFSELLNNRQENIMNILGPTAYDRGRAEEYVANGIRLLEESKGFTEPGVYMDRVMAVDVVNQLRAIFTTPPLTLLINPSSISISYEKVQQYDRRTREGYIFQSWGENQPIISFSGSIGAFIAGGLGQENVPSGVQFASKRDSASYQNLMNLMTIYRNNGYIHDNVTGSATPYFVGAVSIEYDQWVYIGNFNSFSWGYEETENQNGRITFDMEFTAIQVFDNHEPTENILPLKTPAGGYGYNDINRQISDFFTGFSQEPESSNPTSGVPIADRYGLKGAGENPSSDIAEPGVSGFIFDADDVAEEEILWVTSVNDIEAESNVNGFIFDVEN